MLLHVFTNSYDTCDADSEKARTKMTVLGVIHEKVKFMQKGPWNCKNATAEGSTTPDVGRARYVRGCRVASNHVMIGMLWRNWLDAMCFTSCCELRINRIAFHLSSA